MSSRESTAGTDKIATIKALNGTKIPQHKKDSLIITEQIHRCACFVEKNLKTGSTSTAAFVQSTISKLVSLDSSMSSHVSQNLSMWFRAVNSKEHLSRQLVLIPQLGVFVNFGLTAPCHLQFVNAHLGKEAPRALVAVVFCETTLTCTRANPFLHPRVHIPSWEMRGMEGHRGRQNDKPRVAQLIKRG